MSFFPEEVDSDANLPPFATEELWGFLNIPRKPPASPSVFRTFAAVTFSHLHPGGRIGFECGQ